MRWPQIHLLSTYTRLHKLHLRQHASTNASHHPVASQNIKHSQTIIAAGMGQVNPCLSFPCCRRDLTGTSPVTSHVGSPSSKAFPARSLPPRCEPVRDPPEPPKSSRCLEWKNGRIENTRNHGISMVKTHGKNRVKTHPKAVLNVLSSPFNSPLAPIKKVRLAETRLICVNVTFRMPGIVPVLWPATKPVHRSGTGRYPLLSWTYH